MKTPKDRRNFVKKTVSVGGAFMMPAIPMFLLEACKQRGSSKLLDGGRRPPAVTAAAGTQRIRKSAHAMDAGAVAGEQNDLFLYARAFQELQKTTAGQDVWEAFALVHQNCCPHGNWFFLPWHRVYLYHFENMIRDVLRDLVAPAQAEAWALPFWDWERPGMNGKLPRFAVTPGKGLHWTGPKQAKHKANGREFGQRNAATTTGGVDQRFIGPQAIATVLASRDLIALGSGRNNAPRDNRTNPGTPGSLERMPHNMAHGWMGGDMGAFLSPRDPVFWMHHCNVDRIWAQWAAKVGTTKEIPPNPTISLFGGGGIKTSVWLEYDLAKNNTFEQLPAGEPATFVRYVRATGGAPFKVGTMAPGSEPFKVSETLNYRTLRLSYKYSDVTVPGAGLRLGDGPEGVSDTQQQGGEAAEQPFDYQERLASYSAVLKPTTLAEMGRVFEFDQEKALVFSIDLDKWFGAESVEGTGTDGVRLLERFKNNERNAVFNLFLDGVPQPTKPEQTKIFFFGNQTRPVAAPGDGGTPSAEYQAIMENHYLGAHAFFTHVHGGPEGNHGLRLVFDLASALKSRAIIPNENNNVFIMVAVESPIDFPSKLKPELMNMKLSVEYYEE